MNLPKQFQFLATNGTLPRMIANALSLLGTKEIKGPVSNPVIMKMAKEIGVDDIYKNDDTSWCALFQCYICKISNKPGINPKGDKYNLLRAKSFAEWGNPVVRGEEMLGDILVFKRPGGFHVGMYVAESKSTFFVLGGNQGNAVTITEISKNRLTAARRYYATAAPASVKKYNLDSSGKLSTNEA
jgi:uncharacterized protein (TIGR02594 family)